MPKDQETAQEVEPNAPHGNQMKAKPVSAEIKTPVNTPTVNKDKLFDRLGLGIGVPFLLSIILGLIASPRVKEMCSSWSLFARGICLLREVPADLHR